MSFNGSGTFVLNIGGYPYVANTTIVSANVNALLQDIANGLSLTVTRDGQMSMTGPLHMAAQLIDGIKNLQFSTTTTSPPVGSDGWFLTAAHTLTLATNGTNGLSQNSTGNVSIATASSGTTFTVSGGGAAITGNSTITGTTTALSLVSTANNTQLSLSDGTITGAIFTSGGSTLYFGSTSNHALNLRTNGADRVVITNAGNITSNAPTSGTTYTINAIAGQNAIAVSDGTASSVWFTNGGSGIIFGTTSNHLFQFLTNNTNRGSIAAAGAWTLATPASGNHQFNGLTQYSDGTTNSEIGWRGLAPNSQSGTTYTIATTDRSRLVSLSNAAAVTVTLIATGFNNGDVVMFRNITGGTNNVTLTGSGTTLLLAGTQTSGNRTIANRGVASAVFDGSNWLIYGPGVS